MYTFDTNYRLQRKALIDTRMVTNIDASIKSFTSKTR